jgi:hypothetical protein
MLVYGYPRAAHRRPNRAAVSARAAPLEKGLSNRQLKYTVMKRKQCVSFLAALVVRIILIYLEVPI